jgi:YD repeat-containing protein
MKNHFLMLLLLSTAIQINTSAQYYHKDIVNNKQAFADKILLQEQKIRDVMVHSFEGDKSPSKGFFCKKEISKNYRTISTYTKSDISNKSLLISYYDETGLLIKSVDSSSISSATSTYVYDANGNLISILSQSRSYDDDFATTLSEVRQYSYNGKNKPTQLLRIKNGQDSVLIDFLQDEKGNITDEIEPGKNGKHYYYYYDDKNRLTDIVQYNVVKAALVPDFIFEYNRQNQVTQMIAVEEGMSGNYYVWQYIYNDEGLKIIEKCLSKERVLLGYFEYEYN